MLIGERLGSEFAAQRLRRVVIQSLDPSDLPRARAHHRAAFDAARPDMSDVIVEDFTITVEIDGRRIGLRIVVPAHLVGRKLPAVLWIHGGGYLIGFPDMDDARLREMALDLECAVVAVDYRLAPENPYPAGLDDCLDVFRWLQTNADGRVDGRRLAVAGASAGGGLALGMVLRQRDLGLEMPAALAVYAPMIDDRSEAAGDGAVEDAWTWNGARNQMAWQCYLGPARACPPPYAAFARAGNLSGLPPIFIAVGALDHFLTENLRLVERLSAAGVEVELQVVPGAAHGFEALVPDAALAKRARSAAISAIRRSQA